MQSARNATVNRPEYAQGSLLSVTHLSLGDISGILSETAEIQDLPSSQRAQILRGRTIALLFYESSTRTRTSFELAAKSLGATTTLVSDKSSSIEKGESLKDTGLTLRALGAECIILRHSASGAPFVLARETGLPVLNAGDGMHEHPSQALLDLRTILTLLYGPDQARSATERSLDGVTVTITGDILHSRVARSNAMLLPRLGARVLLCGPQELLPENALGLGPGVEIERDFDRALQKSQVAMMLRIQKERLAGLELDLNNYISRYQLNGERLASHAPKALVMHPGPMIRGLEITDEVADGPQSTIEQQVTHGLAIRSALLARALCAGGFQEKTA
ncbi:aspartate carbamoyltransferase catalytic subunit [Edaphobacter albus]|uniref:aspartate carbamoyltransferase catalytic subunit n=1 Tax=Edaphobacter sp. 4G125 TaxID=2763071 RepID=UPI00164548B8|nr:aspartate carbamoyltransferase catalytic subunit [Edaphobacter sp. 4G125]QNI36675.1 aspartate carbamoyltransferase catalytic subunit [Edaphobacter sp. 4G125]